MKPRYYISAWHGEAGTIFTVIDSHTGRAKGQTSTWRDGAHARQLAVIQTHALIYAHNTRQLQRRRHQGNQMTTTTEQKEDHGQANARGWSETIIALVAALECDYDRLEELRDERNDLAAHVEACHQAHAGGTHQDIVDAAAALAAWDKANDEELKDLADAANVEEGYPCKSREDAEQRIQESALSVEVRSGWVSPGDDMQAEDFTILLTTGGPALRIVGEIDEHKQPRRAWLEYQDWGTPWTEFHGEGAPSQAELLTFCQCFYFGG